MYKKNREKGDNKNVGKKRERCMYVVSGWRMERKGVGREAGAVSGVVSGDGDGETRGGEGGWMEGGEA